MNIIWILELANEGARNLLRHKLRSLLSLLGIVIGVGAVIAMMAVGAGAQRKVLQDIGGLGLHNIIVDSEQTPASSSAGGTSSSSTDNGPFQYGLIPRDAEEIKAVFPSATILIGHLVKRKILCRSTRINAAVLGVTPDYFELSPVDILAGRLIAELDNRDRHRVAVITEEVARAIPVVGGTLGATLRIGYNNDYFKIVGVIRMASSKGSGQIFLPYTTAKDVFGTLTRSYEDGKSEYTKNEIGRMVIHLEDEAYIPDAAAVTKRILDKNHPKHDFTILAPLVELQIKQNTQRTFDLILLVIASISLIVGGIGIMNIMLAIVMERIKEIGIRRALGASQNDILLQFLAETVVLSTSGGILGCLLGAAVVPVLSRLTQWPGVFIPSSIIIALVFSWLVGVIFGIAPAIQAAKMHPVDCLRYE